MAQQTLDRSHPTGSSASTVQAQRREASGAAPIELAPPDRGAGWRTAARIVFSAASWLLVAGLVVQVFLAGLGVFDSPELFGLHATFGFALMALPLLMLLCGLAGGVGRRSVGLAGLLFGLFFLQSILASLRGQMPAIAALHPLNGFLILFISIAVARASFRLARSRDTADQDQAEVPA
jgi:hypothetical protein